MKTYYKNLFLLLLTVLVSSSCFDLVEEGIRIDYPLSEATLTVEPLNSNQGAENAVISFKIEASALVDIKSCIVQSTNDGQNGTGFNVSAAGYDDPFIDHIFGTIQKNTRSFRVRYDYIIPQGINKNRLTFSLIDESGKVSVEQTVEVVPDIVRYNDQYLYALDKNFHDAFASNEGVVYQDIKTNYSSLSEENISVQKNIDIIFYYDKQAQRSTLAAPASSRLGLSLNVENGTLFKKLSNLNGLDFSEVTPASLIELSGGTSLLTEGELQVDQLVVGDVIGFITDLNALYSLKAGLLKVNGLHPASVPHYPGVSYVLECDIIVQK